MKASAFNIPLFVFAIAVSGLAAQTPTKAAEDGRAIEHRIFPDRTYDPSIPAPTRALGYELGKDLATYAKLGPYLQQLDASSDRVQLATHAESWEGRPIYNLTISAPENIARLDEIRANIARLADPRRLSGPEEVERIVRNTPVVVMLVFATDGSETAAPEAAMQVAYQLAAGTDAHTLDVLRNTVVIIVPAQNPDANQRTVAWYNAFRVGADGTADPDAAEHWFPWGINSNNRYQIDPNRESVWSTQRETRAMVALYREWNPQVFVDNHGEYPVYTGPAYAEPLHEVLTARQREWHRKFGEAMPPAFAKHDYEYAAWEYGQFDPGYWDTYPNFSGAIAWTTETTGGGSRGLRIERRDNPPHTLADGIIQHMIASDVTLGVAARNREQLLRDFHAYKTSAIEEGRKGAVKAYAISVDNDPRTLASVVNTLRRNRIEVHRTTREVSVNGARAYFEPGGDGRHRARSASLPAGSYIMSLAQPESRMLRVLMEPEAKFSRDFRDQIAQARAVADSGRAAGRMFYDITAWSMPFTYNLEAYELAQAVPANTMEAVTEDVAPRGGVVAGDARYAFLVDYTSNVAIHAIARLRREEVVYRIAPEPFEIGGRKFGAGTAVILAAENQGRDLGAFANTLASEIGVTVVGVNDGKTDSAFRLEPDRLVPARPGRIAVVMDRPVSTSSYGHIWYTFEQLYGIDFTALNFDRLISTNLDKYSVLILPDGSYGNVHRAVAADVATKLRAWVEKGGTLIGVRGGSAWIAQENNQLTAARVRRHPTLSIPGTVLRASIADAQHPLVRGYGQSELPVMVWSNLAFDANAPVEAPLRIAEPARAHVSGYLFPESLTHIAGSPYVVHDRVGKGSVVLFLDDPNFRLFWDGLTRLFFNAVFLADGQPAGM